MEDKKYENYVLRVNEVERIFEKLDPIFDISKYKKILDEQKNKVEEFYNAKQELNKFDYDTCIERLDYILEKTNEDYLPYYEVYLLNSHIKNSIDKMTEMNYKEIKEEVKKLINSLDNVSTTQREDCQKVIEDSYETICRAIVSESMLEKNEILSFLKEFGAAIVKSKVGSLIRRDLVSKVDNDEVLKIELSHVGDGIDFNYLSSDVVGSVGYATKSDVNEEYKNRRQTATVEFLDILDDVNKERNNLKYDKKENRTKINNLRLRLAAAHLKTVSLLIVPVMALVGTWSLGGKMFKNTTTTTNITTNKQIEDTKIEYLPKTHAYIAKIKKCSPWRVNENGGYIRDVEEYQYTDDDNFQAVSAEKIMESIKAKSTSTETKEVLYDEDSMEEEEIILTETLIDINDSKPNILASFFLTIAGGFGLWVVDIIISLAVYGITDEDFSVIEYTKDSFIDLINLGREYRKTHKVRLTRKVVKERVEEIAGKIVKLKEEFNDINDKYGLSTIKEQMTEEQLNEAKKYIKIK